MYDGMKSLTAYFGEDWDAGDPSRVLRVVRDFVNLFNKAHGEIEVLPSPTVQAPLPRLAAYKAGCTPVCLSFQQLMSMCGNASRICMTYGSDGSA